MVCLHCLSHLNKQINKSSFSCSYCWQALIFVMTSLFFRNEKYSWTIFQSRSNHSYTLGLYSLISMMHSLEVMFFGLVPAPFGILNNSYDLEAFSQPHCLQVWGICLKKQTSQWRQKKLVGYFPLVFIYQIIRTRRDVFTILCFRPKMLCKTKILWGKIWFQLQCLVGFPF